MEAISPLEIVRNPKARFADQSVISLNAAIAYVNTLISNNIKLLKKGDELIIDRDNHFKNWLPEFNDYKKLAKKIEKKGWIIQFIHDEEFQQIRIEMPLRLVVKQGSKKRR